jgi:iron complex transport system substrate-binding protein
LRIVSLIPAGTDLAVSLGLADNVVGVSHECDNPRVLGRPVLTSSILPVEGAAPADIDRTVTEHAHAGQPLYRTDTALLADLRPTVVLAQDICDVCAVPGAVANAALPPGAELVMLRATTLAGLEADLLRLGGATGKEAQAVRVIDHLRALRAEVVGRVAGWPRPRVLTLEWGDPPFLGGHWVPELVDIAGGDHLLVGPGEPSRRSTWDEVTMAAADVIVYMPCGYGIGPAVDEGRGLLDRIPSAGVWATDATSMFSRCTPASVSHGLHALAGMLHPEVAPSPDPMKVQRLR